MMKKYFSYLSVFEFPEVLELIGAILSMIVQKNPFCFLRKFNKTAISEIVEFVIKMKSEENWG